MAPDAGTPARHESRRKTLDDIRREIEAEYCPPALADHAADSTPAARRAREADEDADLDDELLLRRLTAPERASDWRGYVMAGVIGCIAGQLIILGYVAVARYGGDLAKLRESFSMPRLSAPLLRTDDTTVSASVRRESVAPPDARSPAELLVPAGPGSPAGAEGTSDAATAREEAPASGAVSDRDAASSRVAATPPSALPATPPAAVPATPARPAPAAPAVAVTPVPPVPPPAVPPRRGREERNEGPPQPAVVRQAPPRVAPSPETSSERSLPGPDNWVESQAQLRAALGEWLTLWERGGDAEVSEAEVVLGADGRTAKTLVPTRSGNRIVFREQRWERGRRGWTIVAEREVAPPGR
jgi:hypothetical protein